VVGDLHLGNPLTGGRVALPPITTLRGFEGDTCFDEDGNLAYTSKFDQEPAGEDTMLPSIPVAEAADCTYHQAVHSCAPSSAAGACVVLLLHSPGRQLSYARPGDKRWTYIPPGDGATGLQQRNLFCNASYNHSDGLFYVLDYDHSIYSLDLSGPSPVVTRIIPQLTLMKVPAYYRYLIHTPWGDLLQAWRFRDDTDPSVEVCTDELRLYRVDSHAHMLVKVEEGLPHHVLFLGYNEPLCLPVADFPQLKPNCAYITDDAPELVNFFKHAKREVGIWDIQTQRLQSFDEASNWPPPIWITPSLL
jgi:hypothetical protein